MKYLIGVAVRPEGEFIAQGEIGSRPIIVFDGDIAVHELIEGRGALRAIDDLEQLLGGDGGLNSARSGRDEIVGIVVGEEVLDEVKSFAVKGSAIGDSVRIDISGQGDETLIGIDFNELVFAIGDVIDVIEVIDEEEVQAVAALRDFDISAVEAFKHVGGERIRLAVGVKAVIEIDGSDVVGVKHDPDPVKLLGETVEGVASVYEIKPVFGIGGAGKLKSIVDDCQWELGLALVFDRFAPEYKGRMREPMRDVAFKDVGGLDVGIVVG